MKISVVIPIHNGEKTLVRSIVSVARQTYQPSEIICVLNCCTDKTEELLFGLQNKGIKNIKIVHCDHMKGIVPALNTGILKSEGDFIARQDADDLWYFDKLEKQVSFLEKNTNIDILGTQIRLVNEFGVPKEGQEPPRPLDDRTIKNTLLAGWSCIAHPSVLYKKDIVLRCGMYTNTYPMAEDYDLWLRALKWFTFANHAEVLIDYTAVHNVNYNPSVPKLLCQNMNLVYNILGLK